MKYLTALLTAAALFFAPLVFDHALARPDPPITPSCYIAVLTVFVGTVMVVGVYHLCQYANQQNQDDPPDIPPDVSTNMPCPGAPFQVLPPLHLQQQLFGHPIVGQHQDTGLTFRSPTNWVTDFAVVAQPDGMGGITMTLTDANGFCLGTNTAREIDTASARWLLSDFTATPLAITNNPPCRVFRLVGLQ